MKLKNTSFNALNGLFLQGLDIENLLVSSKIFFCERISKFFIGCFYDDSKINPLDVMLPIYVKHYDGQTKWMYFFH